MNTRQIVLLKEATDDLRDGKSFYDRIQEGVGDYFWDSLISDIESLLVYAGIHTKLYGFYRMQAKRFPYAIYYQMFEETAYVVAVLPMRQDPKWIKGKLRIRH